MAELYIRIPRIIENINRLGKYLSENNIQWSLITKVLCGNKAILKEILRDEVVQNLHSIGESRLSSLKVIKAINPKLVTMYIKPPAIKYAAQVVKYADISLNTSFKTISALNDEAINQNKIHKIMIMIELGELREGIVRENIIDFYQKVFELTNIRVIGIGTNLGCMYGIEPTYDKLIQLSLYERLLEAMFDRKIDLISGGSSITLPLIAKHKIPVAVNHFRIGEAIFLGDSPLNGKKFRNLFTDIFEFKANIIELEKKEPIPDGNISDGNVGNTEELELENDAPKSYRAILDFGVLDVAVNNLIPKYKGVTFLGTTSDMTVYDLGKNKGKKIYRIGEKITFYPDYMAVARLMNSKFVTKTMVK